MSNDQLNKITDFFRPNRLIWQDVEEYGSSNADADTDTDVDTDTDRDIEGRESPDDLVQVMQIIKQAKSECDTSKKAICSLSEEGEWNLGEANRLRKFIDELDYKFFVKGEGEDKLGNTSERLKRLEEQLNMEKIIKEFLKTKAKGGYEIVANDPVINDHIVFHYKDGSTKRIFLEMSLNPPKPVSTGGQNEEAGLQEEQEEANEENEQGREAVITKYEDLIERSKDLTTPDKAYRKLKQITHNLPDDLLKELSVPLSEIAKINADSTIDYEDTGREFKRPKGSDESNFNSQLSDIIKKYFDVENKEDFDRKYPEENEDLIEIGKVFFGTL